MDITNKIGDYLKQDTVNEVRLPKSVKKFIDYCMDYGVSKREVDSIIRKNKNNLSDAIDDIMELVRDDVSPGDFDEIDQLLSS